MNQITYVNPETGEIFTHEQLRAMLSAETRQISAEQKTGLERRNRAYVEKHTDKRTFLKYSRLLRGLHPKLSVVQSSALLHLSLHIYMNGSGLIKTGELYCVDEKNAMTMKEMASVVGKSRQGMINIVEHLTSLDIIEVNRSDGRNPTYSISEKYISYGAGENMRKNHVKLYRGEMKERTKVLPNPKQHLYMDMLTDTEAGILFKLLAYVHEQHFILCSNPTEKDMQRVKYMTARELAEVCGIKYTTFRNALVGLRRKGVIGKFSSGITVNKGDAHVLNPKIVDCGALMDEETRGTVRSLFEITAQK
ncbi:hypothetical protein BWGOE4_44990 [Bacillus mycoides]|uniref:hypothetical protein n=1 Tax=Bacillus mycoides TaxID=1405 RepID=UPI00087319EF|nr:hypothetical protein [Bacillus mycoides]OFD54010.1 hypothetical protein BWGOE4_44990 [Bacillus mycoides]OFD60484.1 hypothetical protein BWGOE7_45160 [Bacillus mycoides]OFD90724.1 hypothetical protein BWGOE12_45230 [Bacillus mycoides]